MKFAKKISVNRVGRAAWSIIRLVIILGLCFEILYPFIVKILQMFMSVNDLSDPTVKLYPREFSTFFIQRVYSLINYPVSLFNTFFVSIVTSVIQLFICTMAGYGFARFKFRGRLLVFAGVLIALLVPPQVYSTSLYLSFRFFGISGLGTIKLVDSIWPYTILSLTGLGLRNGLYIYIMRQFFKGMPRELEEAAYIDGYNVYETFFNIMLPNARNMLLTIFILSFAWQWTDVFYSNLFSLNMLTLSSAILQNIRMVATDGSYLNPLHYSVMRNTAAILAIAPLILIFGIAQKQLVQGVERSGIVG